MKILKTLFSLLVFSMLPVLSFAQIANNAQSKQPVSIEASDQLEWLRAKYMYRATKDVVITQGDTVIKGDNAEASYDPAIGQSALTVMTVTGHVTMVNQGRTITADKGVYDTRTKLLVLTGEMITLTTPDGKVTSTKEMTYNSDTGVATATGNAVVTQPDKQLKGDKIVATMDPATNKLQHAVATGHVIITHKTDKGTDISQSQKATYDMGADIINLDGDVKLTSGTNHMQGDAAVINLKTGVSNLKNNSTQGGRVRAIFSTGSSSAPLSAVTGSIPVIKPKDRLEQPYAVDNKPTTIQNRGAQGLPTMPGM